MTPDADLLELLAARPVVVEVEFARFYMEYQPRLLRFVRRIAQGVDMSEDRLDAEGVVQDTFEQAWRVWEKIDQPERWIFRVAARKVHKHSQREWYQERLLRRELRVLHATRSDPPDPAYAHALASDVKRRILSLPTNQRIATYLHHVEQWTGAEIAELLDITSGTVGAHIHRGTTRVRAALVTGTGVEGTRAWTVVSRDMHMDLDTPYRLARYRLSTWSIRLFAPLLAVLGFLAVVNLPLALWIAGGVVALLVIAGVGWAVHWVVGEIRWRWRYRTRW